MADKSLLRILSVPWETELIILTTMEIMWQSWPHIVVWTLNTRALPLMETSRQYLTMNSLKTCTISSIIKFRSKGFENVKRQPSSTLLSKLSGVSMTKKLPWPSRMKKWWSNKWLYLTNLQTFLSRLSLFRAQMAQIQRCWRSQRNQPARLNQTWLKIIEIAKNNKNYFLSNKHLKI